MGGTVIKDPMELDVAASTTTAAAVNNQEEAIEVSIHTLHQSDLYRNSQEFHFDDSCKF